MRKKSAFLEKLTARAAAAFEAGSSSVAPDGQYGQDDQEKSYVAHYPASEGLPLHEQGMAVYATSLPEKLVSHDGPNPLPYPDDTTDRSQGLPGGIVALPVIQPEPKQVSQANAEANTNAEHKEMVQGFEKRMDVTVQAEKSIPDRPLSNNRLEHIHNSDHKERGTGDTVHEQGTGLDSDIERQSKQAKLSILSPEDDEERVCASLGFVAKILFAHLISMEKNVLNMKKLSLYNQNNMLISYASIRTAWGRLKKLGIISHSARHDIGKDKGVLFQLNGQYTFAFQKLYGHMLVKVQTELGTQQGTEQSIQQSIEQGTELCTKLGADQARQVQTQEDSTKTRTKLEVHPEYHFWREYGLTQIQCSRWKEEFGLDELLLDSYLRWCALDLGQGERKDKSGKNISNPANWFYSILKKTGSYPKPEGYQSHEEKTFLAREQALKEQANLQARKNALRVQEEKQEAEALFVAFLEEGEGAPYFHDLCQKITPFLYENRHARRRLFENALRTEYFKFLGIVISD